MKGAKKTEGSPSLVHRTVWCTRVDQLQLASFGFSGSLSAIIHWTVRCSTGLSGVPCGPTATVPTVEFNGRLTTLQCELHAQKLE